MPYQYRIYQYLQSALILSIQTNERHDADVYIKIPTTEIILLPSTMGWIRENYKKVSYHPQTWNNNEIYQKKTIF